MINENPIGFIKEKVRNVIKETLRETYPDFLDRVEIIYPPSKSFGDLSSTIAFQIAYSIYKDRKEANKKVNEIAENIFKTTRWNTIKYISEVKVVNGYINLFLNYPLFNELVIKSILNLGEKYGYQNIGNNKKITVEHTSANPIHPLHIGTARNAILGDSLSRILKTLGYRVETRFYVNDMGRQVAYLVYGYSKIRDKIPIHGKPDHWFGALYSVTTSIIETLNRLLSLKELKEKIEKALQQAMDPIKRETDESTYLDLTQKITRLRKLKTIDWTVQAIKILERLGEINENTKKIIENFVGIPIRQIKDMLRDINEWLKVLSEIAVKWPEFFDLILREALLDEHIEEKISDLIKKYENGNENVSQLFQEICKKVLDGFIETLSKVDIHFDKFDWESDLVRSNYVNEILSKLKERGWTFQDETGALYLNIRRALREVEEVREIFDLDKEFIEKAFTEGKEDDLLPPNLVLVRSDGTTLYTTRDIAYSLLKARDNNVDKVFNVIGKDQTLPQKQLKVALYLAGYEDIWNKIHHVAYELVIIPGAKLSARRGRYITFDEILEEAEDKAYEEVTKRHNKLSEDEKREIARNVAIGAVRYALISTAPDKTITFDWSRVLDFERNSGPFLQYSYARATSILRKANWELPEPDKVNYGALKEETEKELILQLSRFPETIYEAGTKIRPDILAEYANKIAVIFNSFYQRYPVLRAETKELRDARLLLVEAFRITMRNTLNLLGIKALERM
mgnify:CR=1 FL=1